MKCPSGGVCGLSEDVCKCTEMSVGYRVKESHTRSDGVRVITNMELLSVSPVLKPPLGQIPRWIRIEHWMDKHRCIGWIAWPIHYIALQLWRRRQRR